MSRPTIAACARSTVPVTAPKMTSSPTVEVRPKPAIPRTALGKALLIVKDSNDAAT